MGTTNFVSHENGIFVLNLTEFEQMKEWMEEDEFFEETREYGLTENNIYEQLEIENRQEVYDFLEHQLGYLLEQKGYSIKVSENKTKGIIYNPKGKILADVELREGYYNGVQLIVETNPEELFVHNDELYFNYKINDFQDELVKSKLYEVYSPMNRRMFKIIEQCTTRYSVVGKFNDGTCIYGLG